MGFLISVHIVRFIGNVFMLVFDAQHLNIEKELSYSLQIYPK